MAHRSALRFLVLLMIFSSISLFCSSAEEHPQEFSVDKDPIMRERRSVKKKVEKLGEAISVVHKGFFEPAKKVANDFAVKLEEHAVSVGSVIGDTAKKIGRAIGFGKAVPLTAVPEMTMALIIIGWVVARNLYV